MADVQSNIKVSIDTTDALASIKNLQRQISAFHTSMAKGGAAANAVTAQMQQTLINSLNATGKFSAQMRTIKTTTESFTSSLEKNKFTLGEYFRYAGGASKTFGKLFKTEFDTINKVARENVKDLQTQYIKLGRDANGAMKAIAVRPLSLDMNDLATKTMIASEKQALLNQLLKQGSTNLLNFGKNTQWAGRQLMVGFTIPLITVGSQAAKTFMDMETQAIRFKKVYGDIFTPQAESAAALDSIKNLGKEFTKYGVAVSATVGLAADAAAAGYKGVDLQNQTTAATRLSILGQIDNQQALETTIALQNAFGTSSAQLASTIDFLNAVENQTVLSLDDVTTAIPKAAPVVKQLGGDVKDLAFFLTAMKQGGINASEGANALKSGLASMINPTAKASAMLAGFGINIKKIVVDNRGDLKKTVIDFATALNQLDPLNRAQAIEQMFGKFQFARISTLMQNVTAQGTQASKVLDLAGASVQDLANLSEKELGITSESAMNKFKASVENLKLSLVPVGEEFLKAVTPIAEFVTKILDKFNNLGDGTKKIIVTLTTIIAGLGPVLLMTFGLLANGIANIIKGFVAVKTIFNKTGQSSATLGTEVKYMTLEQRNAAAIASSLDQVHNTLAQTFTAEASAVDALTRAYLRSIEAQRAFIPTGVPMGRGPVTAPKKFASGGIISGPGGPTDDLVPIMASDGEAIISADIVKKFPGLIGRLTATKLPGFKKPGIVSKHTGRVAGGSIMTPTHGGSGIMAPGNYAGKAKDSTIAGMSSDFIGGEQGATPEFIASSTGSLKTTLMALAGLPRLDEKAIAEYEAGWTGINTHLDEIGNIFATGLTPDIKDVSELGQKQFPKMMAYIDELEKSLQISAEQAQALRDATRKVYNPDLGTVSNPGKDAVRKNSQRVETGIDAQGNEVVTRVGAERVPLPGKSSGDYLDEKTKRITEREYKRRGLAAPSGKMTFAHVKSGKQELDYIPPTTSGVPSAAEQKILKKLSERGSKISQGEIITTGNSIIEKQATSDAKVYVDTVKKKTEDIYPASRERKSPHPLASKDGKDDANSYETAREKEIKKRRRAATRAQGAPTSVTTPGKRGRRSASRAGGTVGPDGRIIAPLVIGPDVPEGTSLLGMTTPLTDAEKRANAKRQRKAKLLGGMKAAGSKLGTRLGGGTALLGANMALSAIPDFAGKSLVQNTMTGANMGMLFGPWGAAAGGAIGLVTTAMTTLIAKEREHDALIKSAFVANVKDVEFFGDAVLNTTLKINAMQASVKGITNQFGDLSPQVQAFVDYVSKLDEKDPTKVFVEGLKKVDSLTAITGNIRAKVATAISVGGMDPKNAKEYVAGLLAAAGKSKDFQKVWASVQASVKTTASATTTTLNKLSSSVKQNGRGWLYAGETLRNLAGAMTNGSLTSDQFLARLNGIKSSALNGADGINALRLAINKSGDKEALAAFDNIAFALDGIGKKSVDAVLGIMAVQNANITPEKAAQMLGKRYYKDLPSDFMDKQNTSLMLELAKSNPFLKLMDERNKLSNAANNIKPYTDPSTSGAGTAKENPYLKILQQQIDALKAKRDAQKDANDELQRQIDLEMKMQDLANQATQAKISGNYLQAAMLTQESKNVQMKFNQETELKNKDAQIAALEARYKDIKNGAALTAAEKAKIPKKANGGLIRGAGTGRSDSIRASLGYAGGGSIRVSNGEFVVKASSVADYGLAKMNAINNGTADIDTNSGGTVYNINMPITANQSDPKAVGEYVINKLKVELNKNNKNNRVVM